MESGRRTPTATSIASVTEDCRTKFFVIKTEGKAETASGA